MVGNQSLYWVRGGRGENWAGPTRHGMTQHGKNHAWAVLGPIEQLENRIQHLIEEDEIEDEFSELHI